MVKKVEIVLISPNFTSKICDHFNGPFFRMTINYVHRPTNTKCLSCIKQSIQISPCKWGNINLQVDIYYTLLISFFVYKYLLLAIASIFVYHSFEYGSVQLLSTEVIWLMAPVKCKFLQDRLLPDHAHIFMSFSFPLYSLGFCKNQ